MTATQPEHNISEKVKEYLIRKLNDCKHDLIKLKRKKKRIKILYVTTVIASIIISTAVASLTSMVFIPAIVITTLSATSAILTGISTRFNFQNKKMELQNLIDKLNKIQSKLDYVISCNGNLTQKEYEEILKDF
jgi:SMODS and SLOG-associating 2TM effector domain